MPWRGRRLTEALLTGLALVLLLGTGGAIAVSSIGHREAGAGAAARPVAPTRAIDAATTGRTAAGTSTAGAVRGPSNNLTVQLLPGAGSGPRAQDVQQLLQNYFDAINQHDYANWAQVVAPSLAKRQNSGSWLDAYASTVDSSIGIESIAGAPPRVRVRFTSQQDTDLAPPDLQVDCINWVLSYQLEEHDGRLVVGSTLPGTVSRDKCS